MSHELTISNQMKMRVKLENRKSVPLACAQTA